MPIIVCHNAASAIVHAMQIFGETTNLDADVMMAICGHR